MPKRTSGIAIDLLHVKFARNAYLYLFRPGSSADVLGPACRKGIEESVLEAHPVLKSRVSFVVRGRKRWPQRL